MEILRPKRSDYHLNRFSKLWLQEEINPELLYSAFRFAVNWILKLAAKASGNKKIEMVPVKELLSITGYVRGGCSPIGMKKKFPTYLDETCQLWNEISVSAGERGHQMLIPYQAIVSLTNAKLVDIIV